MRRSAHTHPLRLLLLLVLTMLVFVIAVPRAASAQAAPHRLMVNDQIELRVVEWRPELGVPTAWEALAGLYVVDAAGQILVPLIGAVDVAGRTTEETAQLIASDIQRVMGMVAPPGTSVEVMTYNPVYVLGDVATPGAHPWSPGLTVAMALALAEGERRVLEEGAGALRELARASGEVALARGRLAQLRGREARLMAEISEAETVSFPETFGHPGGPKAEATIRTDEQRIFASRREGLQRDLRALADLQEQYRAESAAMAAKLEGMEGEMQLVADALDRLEGLAESGLVRSDQLLDMQRTMSNLSGQQLDLELALFRAQAQIGITQREIESARGDRATENAAALEVTRGQIVEELRQIETSGVLTGLFAVEAAGLADKDAETTLLYAVSRRAGGITETYDVTPNWVLRPADVLFVRRAIAGTGEQPETTDRFIQVPGQLSLPETMGLGQ